MKHHVLCLADADEHAQEIIRSLTRAGFSKQDISILSSREGAADEFADRKKARTGAREVQVGLLTGVGPALIGGAGHFMGVGRMMQGGEISGVLVRLGLSEHAAQHYENKVAEGGILISVRADKKEAAKVAQNIFEKSHGQEISVA
jgi:Heat induced stress protein YflT domain